MAFKRKFGEDVAGYSIPVLNEREIRAAAGIFFLMMFIAIQQAAENGEFLLLKYAIVIFLTEFVIRLFISPRFAPILIISRWIVRSQVPEYVGAQQKYFAWIIGLVLALIMLVLQIIVNSFSPITGLICLACLIFLFFESVLGICLGCKFYNLFYREKAQHCPGEVCEVHDRHEIQKTRLVHWLILLAFPLYIWLIAALFHENFTKPPFDLFGLSEPDHAGQTYNVEESHMNLGAFSVSLAVKDLQASKTFYEKLGFSVFAGDETQNWLILRNKDHVIGLFQGMFEKNILTFNPGWDQDAQALDDFTDVRELQKELRAKGLTFLTEADESTQGPASMVLEDPDGNQLLFDQHI